MSCRISVIIITYNHEHYISQCIQSILNQDFKLPFEILIGNDASTDQTMKRIMEIDGINSENISIYNHSQNLGMNKNLAFLVARAKGEFITFCEGDDYWHDPMKLSHQYNHMISKPDCSMTYSDYGRLQRIEGKDYWNEFTIPFNILNGYQPTTVDLQKTIHIHISSILARTDLVQEYFCSEFFDSTLALGDVPLFLYLSLKGKIEYFKKSLSTYRLNEFSVTNRSIASKEKVVLTHCQVVLSAKWGQIPKKDQLQIKKNCAKRTMDVVTLSGNFNMLMRYKRYLTLKDWLKVVTVVFLPKIMAIRLSRIHSLQKKSFISSAKLI